MIDAARWHKNHAALHLYRRSALERVLPYLIQGTRESRDNALLESIDCTRKWVFRGSATSLGSTRESTIEEDLDAIHEYQLTFIELLRGAYHEQIRYD